MSIKVWIKAARLRTLPLAIAGAIAGNLIAFAETKQLNILVFIISILTAIVLQILSNYANDYGDFKNGADRKERTDRVMASGEINEQMMAKAIKVLVVTCLILGTLLLSIAVKKLNGNFILLFLFGICGIAAAYFYTAGKKPYGYMGFGDLAVYLFFGNLAVMGTYFLQTGSINSHCWWVASAIGLLSVGVLNVNNLRDIETDKVNGKFTIPVNIGYNKALAYHVFLLLGAGIFFFIYVFFQYQHPLQLSYLLLFPLFLKHVMALKIAEINNRMAYNAQLKKLSLLTLFISIIFSISQVYFLN